LGDVAKGGPDDQALVEAVIKVAITRQMGEAEAIKLATWEGEKS